MAYNPILQHQITQILGSEAAADKLSPEVRRLLAEVSRTYDQSGTKNNATDADASDLRKAFDDLKLSQAQLVHNEKMVSLGQLTAGIAHEINNPVNFVSNGIKSMHMLFDELLTIMDEFDKLEKDKDPDERLLFIAELKEDLEYETLRSEIDNLLRTVAEGAARASEIVKSLRNFSRQDDSKMTKANIHDGINSTLTILQNQLKSHVRVTKEFGKDVPLIDCFPGQLNQVFTNLISNAEQAIEGVGEITIKTYRQARNVVTEVQDTGIGISDEIANRIFEPFFTTKESGEGTGLGLAISYGIVKKHGGDIQVSSTPGQGTTFRVILPIDHDEETVS